MKRKAFKVLIGFFGSAVILFCALFFILLFLLSPVNSSKENINEVKFVIPGGTSVKDIAENLYSQKLIRSPELFYALVRYPFFFGRKEPFVLKSGSYLLSDSMSVRKILDLLESGAQGYIKTVIPEGLTLRKIGALLEKNGVCSSEDFIASCASEELREKYNIPYENLEGFLFADTYFFTPSMNAFECASIMIENFFEKINEIPELAEKDPSEIYDTLILASIVEREYRVQSEAPLIASVFKNRLEHNIGLYSCATIEYIITEIQNKPHPDIITYDDLKINSPYNTYKWAGLPPAPISNPGMTALKAVVYAPETDYYYFTLTDEEAGSHTFSKSLGSHIRAGTQFKTKKAAASY